MRLYDKLDQSHFCVGSADDTNVMKMPKTLYNRGGDINRQKISWYRIVEQIPELIGELEGFDISSHHEARKHNCYRVLFDSGITIIQQRGSTGGICTVKSIVELPATVDKNMIGRLTS